jgi:hypothetical protein
MGRHLGQTGREQDCRSAVDGATRDGPGKRAETNVTAGVLRHEEADLRHTLDTIERNRIARQVLGPGTPSPRDSTDLRHSLDTPTRDRRTAPNVPSDDGEFSMDDEHAPGHSPGRSVYEEADQRCFPYDIQVWSDQRAPPAEAICIRTDGFLDSGAERTVIGFGLRSSYLLADTLHRVAGKAIKTAGHLIPISHCGDAGVCLGRRDGVVVRVTLQNCIFAEDTPPDMLLFAERDFTAIGFSIYKEPGGATWLSTYGYIPFLDPRAIVLVADRQHGFFTLPTIHGVGYGQCSAAAWDPPFPYLKSMGARQAVQAPFSSAEEPPPGPPSAFYGIFTAGISDDEATLTQESQGVSPAPDSGEPPVPARYDGDTDRGAGSVAPTAQESTGIRLREPNSDEDGARTSHVDRPPAQRRRIATVQTGSTVTTGSDRPAAAASSLAADEDDVAPGPAITMTRDGPAAESNPPDADVDEAQASGRTPAQQQRLGDLFWAYTLGGPSGDEADESSFADEGAVARTHVVRAFDRMPHNNEPWFPTRRSLHTPPYWRAATENVARLNEGIIEMDDSTVTLRTRPFGSQSGPSGRGLAGNSTTASLLLARVDRLDFAVMLLGEGWSRISIQMGERVLYIPPDRRSPGLPLVFVGRRDAPRAAESDAISFGEAIPGYGVGGHSFFGPRPLPMFRDTGNLSTQHADTPLLSRMRMDLLSWEGNPIGELAADAATLDAVSQDMQQYAGWDVHGSWHTTLRLFLRRNGWSMLLHLRPRWSPALPRHTISTLVSYFRAMPGLADGIIGRHVTLLTRLVQDLRWDEARRRLLRLLPFITETLEWMRWRATYSHLADVERWSTMLGDTPDARSRLFGMALRGLHPRCIVTVVVMGTTYQLTTKQLGTNDPRVRLLVSVKSLHTGIQRTLRIGSRAVRGREGFHIGDNPEHLIQPRLGGYEIQQEVTLLTALADASPLVTVCVNYSGMGVGVSPEESGDTQLVLADLDRRDVQLLSIPVTVGVLAYQDSGGFSYTVGSAGRSTGIPLPLVQQLDALYGLNNPSLELMIADYDAGRPAWRAITHRQIRDPWVHTRAAAGVFTATCAGRVIQARPYDQRDPEVFRGARSSTVVTLTQVGGPRASPLVSPTNERGWPQPILYRVKAVERFSGHDDPLSDTEELLVDDDSDSDASPGGVDRA